MKEILKKTTTSYMVYQAIDGTEFKDKIECQKYEESSRCLLLSKFKKLVVAESNEWELLRGEEDHKVYAVKINTEQEKDAICQLYFYEHPHLLKDEYRGYLEKWEKLVEDTYNEKDVLLLGMNYDDELYYIDRVQNIVNGLNALGKHDSKTTD